MRLTWMALLVAGAAALAQTPEEKPAAIEGTVVNSVSKMPLRKADVRLANGQVTEAMAALAQQFGGAGSASKVTTKTLGAITDAAGKFRIENVPAGTYWLTASKVGFEDGRYSTGAESSVRLSAGQELKGADIRLVPYASLSGSVVDEDGEPFPSAQVVALTFRYVAGRRWLMPVDFAQANNKGEFSLGKIPPGRYFLRANVQRFGMGSTPPPPPAGGAPETAYVVTYFPNGVDTDQAQRIDAAAGAELSGFTIQLQKSKVVRVRGKLTDANGEPMKATSVMLMGSGPRLGAMSPGAVSDAEGKFEIANVQPGVYTAMVIQVLDGSPKVGMQPLVVPDSNLENVTLGTRSETAIEGKVLVEGDAAAALSKVSVGLISSEGMAVPPLFAKAGDDGVFKLQHVAPASYDLSLQGAPDDSYVKSVTFNDRDALGQVLDCSAIGSGTLRIVLGTDSGKVEVSVSRGDKPAPNATVVLLPADPARRFPLRVRQGSTDEAGRVTLKGVAAGNYLAFAWDKVEQGIWFDPDFVRAAADKSVRVQVAAGGSEKVQLSPIAAEGR